MGLWGYIAIFVLLCAILLYAVLTDVAFFGKWTTKPSTYRYLPTEQEIPKIVYQTWHTHDLPPKMKETNEIFKNANPEFKYHLFDDHECREFIRTHCDQSVLNAFDKLKPGAFKADLWRYCILYVNGGVYLDIKYEQVNHEKMKPVKLIDIIENKTDYPIPMVVETSPLYVYTGFLATPPKNPLYAKCIERIVENVRNQHYGASPMAPTGPELFGSLISDLDKSRAVLFYYDDYFLKEGEEKMRAKYRKRGFIKDLRTEKNILCHYLDYRIEQRQYSKTEYWMNSWSNRDIYSDS